MVMLAFSSNLVMHRTFRFRLYTERYSTKSDYDLFMVKRILKASLFGGLPAFMTELAIVGLMRLKRVSCVGLDSAA